MLSKNIDLYRDANRTRIAFAEVPTDLLKSINIFVN